MSRLGRDRPVSTKLRWRAEISESRARSSWLRQRRARQARSCSPTGRAWVSLCLGLAAPEPQSHYVQVIDTYNPFDDYIEHRTRLASDQNARQHHDYTQQKQNTTR